MRRLLCLYVAAATLVAAIEPPRFPHQPTGGGSKLLTYNITTANPGELSASSKWVIWVQSDNDGYYITTAEVGSFIFENVVSGNKTTFLSADKIPKDYYDYSISSD